MSNMDPVDMSLPTADGESIEPFIDNLWYYDSVMSPKSCCDSAPPLEVPTSTPDVSLPLSTGGLSPPDMMPFLDSYLPKKLESPLLHEASTTPQTQDPQMQEIHGVFDTMHWNHHELCHWMKKLGLQYTEDGMIGSPSSRPVSHNKISVAETRDGGNLEQSGEAHLATLQHEVFQLLKENDNGLISPQELKEIIEGLQLVGV